MNNTQKSSKKTLVTVIVIIVIAALGYFYYEGTIPAVGGNVSISPEDQAVATQVLSLLSQMQSLRIDTSLFNDPAYKTLQDDTVPIPALNVGRPNPFAPIPGEPVAPAAK
ncbi:MAG: hypothetical protein KGI45_00865 [Patescibacteria group bacterium]|nr:hypothetical protein [Patescibacteria group bacterium]MDE1941356.1 hypothetical protein [Patescibacteria group bacterium]MDE1966608.1 hypothetical protein [Patescibacteria group bacterium]